MQSESTSSKSNASELLSGGQGRTPQSLHRDGEMLLLILAVACLMVCMMIVHNVCSHRKHSADIHGRTE